MDDGLRTAVQQMREGKVQSFEHVYSKTYNRVYFRAKMLMGNEEDAKDLTQIVFMEAYKNFGTLESAEALYSWLDGITYRQGMKIFRKKKDVLLAEDAEVVFDMLESNDISSMPEPTADQKATGEIIKEIVEELPGLQRTAVVMYYFDGLKVERIAECMECSVNTVKSRLNYARKYIKSRVEEIEKKQGIRLHTLGLPVLWYAVRLLVSENTLEAHAAELLYNGTCASVGAQAAGAASTGTAAAGSAASTAAEGLSAGSAASVAAEGLSAGSAASVAAEGLSAGSAASASMEGLSAGSAAGASMEGLSAGSATVTAAAEGGVFSGKEAAAADGLFSVRAVKAMIVAGVVLIGAAACMVTRGADMVKAAHAEARDAIAWTGGEPAEVPEIKDPAGPKDDAAGDKEETVYGNGADGSGKKTEAVETAQKESTADAASPGTKVSPGQDAALPTEAAAEQGSAAGPETDPEPEKAEAASPADTAAASPVNTATTGPETTSPADTATTPSSDTTAEPAAPSSGSANVDYEKEMILVPETNTSDTTEESSSDPAEDSSDSGSEADKPAIDSIYYGKELIFVPENNSVGGE